MLRQRILARSVKGFIVAARGLPARHRGNC
jgi:hypothetical protein